MSTFRKLNTTSLSKLGDFQVQTKVRDNKILDEIAKKCLWNDLNRLRFIFSIFSLSFHMFMFYIQIKIMVSHFWLNWIFRFAFGFIQWETIWVSTSSGCSINFNGFYVDSISMSGFCTWSKDLVGKRFQLETFPWTYPKLPVNEKVGQENTWLWTLMFRGCISRFQTRISVRLSMSSWNVQMHHWL